MSLSQFLGIVRARKWAFLAVLLSTIAVATGVSFLLPKQYTASTTLVVDAKGVDPVLGVMMPAQMMPGYLATQVDIIQSHKVAVDVVKKLRLTENALVRQQWLEETEGKGTIEDYFADILQKKLDVKPSRESSVIEIEFTGTDPRFAAVVANAFAEAYQQTNLELRVEPARQSSAWFDERLKQLKKNLEQAQSSLNEYQRAKGFTAQDERLDVESARLSELSAQYTAAQAQAADALSRQRQLNEFLARGASGETIPDVLANPLVQNLKSTLASIEGRLQQTASQLGANHPEVKRLEAEIAAQKSKLKSEISQASASLGNAAKIAQKREAELRAALGAQKAKFLQFNEGRDQMQVLMKEVESAQRAYETAAQRYQQTNLESQASQTNVSVLTRAFPPVEHSFPKIVLNVVLSILLGSVLGVCLVLVLEMFDRRIRSGQELADAVGAPLLGRISREFDQQRKGAARKKLDSQRRKASVAA